MHGKNADIRKNNRIMIIGACQYISQYITLIVYRGVTDMFHEVYLFLLLFFMGICINWPIKSFDGFGG